MKSMIYSGSVMHNRHEPIQHQWTLPYCFLGLDIDELPLLDKSVRGFSYNHRNVLSLMDEHYLTGKGSFRERLSQYIEMDEIENIILITALGIFRKAFNPVSFYYCLKKDKTAACMLAEVNNTYGDRHLYVLEGGEFPLTRNHKKLMHVSPFNNMEGIYRFKFSVPEDDLFVSIQLLRDNKVILDTSLQGRGVTLSSASLRNTLLKHPFTIAKTIPRIFWQAAILYYLKKLDFNKRPEPDNPMTIKVAEK